jgi:hypothetical protein
LLQQWVDLARYTGLQKIKEQLPSEEVPKPPEISQLEVSQLEGGRTEVKNSDDNSSSNIDQSSDLTK